MNIGLEKAILQIHSTKLIGGLLKNRPKDAELIAVSRHKCGSIFYKQFNGRFYADFHKTGEWSPVQQSSLEELEQDLSKISFILIRVDLLEKELELQNAFDQQSIKKLDALSQRVASRIDLVGLRHDADKSDEYWQGQSDAYEIVRHLITDVAAL